MNAGPQASRSIAVVPLAATVIALDDAPPLGVVIAGLSREVVDIVSAPSEILDSPAPERPVVLLWLPPGASDELLDKAVRWCAAGVPRAGLIGCAPLGTTNDAERALAAGFDDFVVGAAISARELAARLRALHRRVHWTGLRRPGRLRFGTLTLNTDGHELWIEGRTITLTSTELAVFRALMLARGKALSRAELLDDAWGDGNLEISERAVDNVILRLRRKIGKSGLIKTVRGVGFRLSTE